MAERLKPEATPIESIENSDARLVDTLVLVGLTHNPSGEDPTLTQETSNAALAAVLFANAGLAGDLALVSDTDSGEELTKRYLEDTGYSLGSLITPGDSSEADLADRIAEFVKANKDTEVGLVIADGSEDIIEGLKKAGVKIDSISLEKEIGARIVEAARNSKHKFEILKQALLDALRYKNIKGVEFMQLTPSQP